MSAKLDAAGHNLYMVIEYRVQSRDGRKTYTFKVHIHEELVNAGRSDWYIRTRYYSETASIFRVMAGIAVDYLSAD